MGTNTWYGPQDGRPSSSAPSKSSLFSGLAGTAGEFRPSPHRLASSSLESNGADSLEGRRNREAEARHHIEMRKRLEEDRGKLERDLERFKLAATAQSQAHEECAFPCFSSWVGAEIDIWLRLMASGKAQLMAGAFDLSLLSIGYRHKSYRSRRADQVAEARSRRHGRSS